jgi:nucleoside-diphosphate-sugar epimerase
LYCTALAEQLVLALPRLINPALKRVVVITSTSIVTKIESEIPAERELLQRYAESERRLAELCEQSGIEWTILRPTVIYAEGRDGNITRIARLIERLGFIPLAGSGKGLRQPVHAEDVAIGAVDAAASATAANRIYAIPGGDTISYREMVGRVFDGMRRPRCIISIAPAIWRTAFFVLNRWLPNANAAMGTRMSNDMVFDPAPARNDFGWNPRPFRPRFD